ncbi:MULTISPECIES: cold shock domain-containing protein [Pseudomonas]|uniref:cold shock domain-containing protein n=1 Tax=Pseudomonas TaxID=286 RepID=UPI0018E0A489|nr:cold shock domain-containing protein [Pseudomonas putida]
MSQENIGGSSIEGVVTSFVQAKGYGFINGDDGEHYFVHVNEVLGDQALVTGQRVTFVPTPSPKGSKAKQVVPGLGPTPIFVEPDSFIWSKGGPPSGMEVVLITGTGWGKSNDPNEARQILANQARELGANAVLNVSMDKWTEGQLLSNYCVTMHRFSGEFAVVKVVSSSFDPEVIARAEQDMQALADWWNNRPVRPENPWVQSAGEARLVEPAKVKLVMGLIRSWTWTFLRILGLSVLNLGRRAFKVIGERLSRSSGSSNNKPEAPGE